MGNSDSQPAVPNTAGTGFSLPQRPKPCSLRFRPTKRKVLSPQSWWRGREVGQGSGLRAPFVHSQYSCFGELTTDRCDRYCTSSGTAASWDLGGDATGVLYAERDAVLDRPVGPVHLLQLARASDHAEANAPPLWTSKGSSLSSEGSWYDSPWGATGELSDADRSCSSGHIEDTRDSASSSGPMEESSAGGGAGRTTIDASLSAPSGGPLALRADLRGFHSLTPTTFADLYGNPSVTSCSSVSGGGAEESCPEPGGFSSHTLPCRKAVPDTDSSSRKSLLKGRMRRFGDWTGSLSRKRRRLQSNDPESLDSGVDVQMDSSPSLPWYLGPYQATPSPGSTYASTLPTRRRRNEDDDHGTFRQNVYETFMRELETVHGADELEPSKETEETSSDSGGSLEQLDLLLEKEHGLVRRAGWLSFKPLITLHKDRRLELVPRRRWRRYWVTLKGCTLLFYESFGKSLEGQDTAPRYALFAEGSIVQAVPEHPKKENVFCLSNAYGDVYLFQAESQTELENWVAAVHSACASLLARQHGKADALRLLRSQTHGLLQKVDMDSKMKKMAELQLSVVNDQKNRKAIESQIEQWERNLERFHMDLFRVRCYLASLQGGEPPNPKMLLAAASRPSKATLGRLGIFSVSSFHALVCSRDEATLRRRSRSQSHGTRRGLLSSLKGLDTLTRCGRDKKQPISQVLQKNPDGQLGCLLACSFEDQKLDGLANHYSIAPPEGNLWDSSLKTSVYFLDNQVINVTVKHDHTVADMLSLACKVRQLDPGHHCLRVSMGMGPETEFITPAPGDLAQGMQSGKLLVFPLNVHTMRLTRPDSSVDYGFAVTGHVDGSRTSHIFVSDINPDGLAFAEGLRPGDEILVLNGSDVSTLDLGLMQTHFGQLKLSLVLRREDVALEDQTPIWPDARPTDFSLLVPPPCPLGVCADMQDEQLSAQLSAEAAAGPDVTCRSLGPCRDEKPDLADGRSQHLQGLETVSMLMPEAQESLECLIELQRTPQAGLPQPPCPRNRPSTEKLRKVMQELVDTEKSYVKDLSCLFEIYLKPLQTQTFLSLAEMESLFGSLPEMLEFQRVFLQTLEDRISSSPDFSTLETPEQVKKLLLSLGGSFLYYADHFKLYSGFCANHTKVQKVLERAKTDWAFKEFLEAKNPTKQHSSTLESYLIKPVQRVLRYPLLLRELVSLTEAGSQEHLHLSEALKAMEKVASHINEMQKIYEDYGVVFDQLVAEQSSTEKEVTEISMGEFLMHSSVTWLNPLPSLGRMRKDPELTVFVFRRAVILVCRDGSRMKRRAQAAARSAASQSDPDPFRFRWLVPLSALQVRLGSTAGSEPNCIWELIHTKSELEGRPEMPFQLCSSSLEAKATIVRTIRSLLREGARRTGPPWRGSRERLGSTPTGAGASLTSWLRKGPQAPTDALDSSQLNPDEGTQSCGTRSSISDLRDLLREQSGSWHPQEQSPAPQQPLGDIPGRKDAERQGPQHDCLTSTIEAQLRRLWLVEEKALMLNAPCVQPEQVELDTHTVMGSTPPAADNPCESQGAPLDGTASADLSGLLERDFSVHSLTSVVNEDCFYDKPERVAPCVRPSSAGASSCSPD